MRVTVVMRACLRLGVVQNVFTRTACIHVPRHSRPHVVARKERGLEEGDAVLVLVRGQVVLFMIKVRHLALVVLVSALCLCSPAMSRACVVVGVVVCLA